MTKFHRSDFVGDHEAGYNLSWGAVFAGTVTFFALLLTLSLIGSAIGFGLTNPTSNDPFAGVGIGVIIWTVISLILAFLGAGFVAGMTARRVGMIHGFLTWALSLLLTVVMLTSVMASAVSAVGSLFGSIVHTTANVTGSVASTAGDAVSAAFDKVAENVNVDEADIDSLNANVQEVLKDTDVPELQPNYLKGQLNEVGESVKQAAKDIATNPENADKTVDSLLKDIQARVDNIAEEVDQDAVATALAKNSDLSQSEAEEATQNIVQGYQKAAKETRTQIENASQALEQTREDVKQSIAELRQTADEASTTAATSSIWAFVAVVLGAALAIFGGVLGTRFVTGEVNEVRA